MEWQLSLTHIAASKGRRFVQVDFSATPYNDVGSGRNRRKVYFPHIITDFDLKTAMRQGLVKSLVLDRRKELGALPLEFKAERDEEGNPVLSEGQREKLFNVDQHAAPRVIVSVLMLREGFDVNNICVIVPLRSSQTQILLEQTIGRGLRLMWRDAEFADSKSENRERIADGQEPNSLIDILSIVEHPAFQSFYDDLMREGLASTTTEAGDTASSIGDLISVGLREDYQDFDFAIPFILREAEEWLEHQTLDITVLQPFSAMDLAQLKALLGKGDMFVSQDLQSSTLFGDYRVDGAVMNVEGYNDFLSRMTRRISQALSQLLPKGNKIAAHLANPYLQVNTAELTGWLG